MNLCHVIEILNLQLVTTTPTYIFVTWMDEPNDCKKKLEPYHSILSFRPSISCSVVMMHIMARTSLLSQISIPSCSLIFSTLIICNLWQKPCNSAVNSNRKSMDGMLGKMWSEKWTLAKHETARDLKMNCIAFIANSEGLISMDYFDSTFVPGRFKRTINLLIRTGVGTWIWTSLSSR